MKFREDIYAEIYYNFREKVSEAISNSFETKHLYQKFFIDLSELDKAFENYSNDPVVPASYRQEFKKVLSSLQYLPWLFSKPLFEISTGYYKEPDLIKKDIIEVENIPIDSPETVELYCSNCKKMEPFNLEKVGSIFDGQIIYETGKDPRTTQIFYFGYRCQLCKRVPEVFILRRSNLKISIDGRSPIEVIQVPSFIPKSVKKFYSDSKIAFNSGQVLPAIFLLRTFLEQYIRKECNDPNATDIKSLFDIYKETLPDEFNSRFPSLYTIYDQLSSDIHEAKGSVDTFTESINEIDKHFDAKRLYTLQ